MTLAQQRPNRETEMDAFLMRSGWRGAQRRMLAADASFRHYARVVYGEQKAVLMDAPPPWEDVGKFMLVSEHLRRYRISVPRILESDPEHGFLLLEDFGDTSFTRLLRAHPEREGELYAAAVDALNEMYQESQSDAAEDVAQLPLYDSTVYLREVALFAEWFLPQCVGMARAKELRQEWLQLWSEVLRRAALHQDCLVHRDYHADNLFWLEDREGYRAVGMLDFQDALWGDAAYDLASLLEDARRDVHPATVAHCLKQFIAASGAEEQAFLMRYAVLAAQRNAKIIGIFTRLAVRDGKQHYLDYLPRVWAHLSHDLQHPMVTSIAEFVAHHVPQHARGAFTADLTVGGIVYDH